MVQLMYVLHANMYKSQCNVLLCHDSFVRFYVGAMWFNL